MNGSSPTSPKAVVLWAIWITLLGAIVFYQASLGGGWLRGDDARSAFQNPAWWIAIGSLLAAAAVRWLFIPKAGDKQRLLVLLVGGMALSEAVEFYGIFLFPGDMPETKMSLFVLSLGSALQFAPVYAQRIFPR